VFFHESEQLGYGLCASWSRLFFFVPSFVAVWLAFVRIGEKKQSGFVFVPSSKMAKSFSPKSMPMASFLAGMDRK
jgi:hypothetical protein